MDYIRANFVNSYESAIFNSQILCLFDTSPRLASWCFLTQHQFVVHTLNSYGLLKDSNSIWIWSPLDTLLRKLRDLR